MVVGDVTYTATYIPSYTVNFYNDETLLQSVVVRQGESATYTGSTPTSTMGPFLEWNPEPNNVMSNIDTYAIFDIELVEPDLKYLTYTLDNTNMTMTITGLKTSVIVSDNLQYITIPDTINGYHVILG